MRADAQGGADYPLRALQRYQYDLFISYSKLDEPIARKLFSWLTHQDLKPFFAPLCLDDAELTTANQWVGVLRQALGQSCHYAALVSPHFLATAWCELELRGFENLIKSNPERCMQLFPLGVNVNQFGADLKHRFSSADFDAFQRSVIALALSGSLHVDDLIVPFPPRIFRPLPLREKYGLVAPWRKDSQTPGGQPAGAPYTAYEEFVREIMVQYLGEQHPRK